MLLSTPLLDGMNSRAYVGQFSRAGDLFVCGFQERRIRVYEVDHDWRLRKEVHCRNLRWTITDTAISPDQNLLAYASITPLVHVVNLRHGGGVGGGVNSVANVTDIHEMLHVGEGLEGVDHVFGIWSARFSRDGEEIVVGTSDSSLYVHHVERNRTLLRVEVGSSPLPQEKKGKKNASETSETCFFLFFFAISVNRRVNFFSFYACIAPLHRGAR